MRDALRVGRGVPEVGRGACPGTGDDGHRIIGDRPAHLRTLGARRGLRVWRRRFAREDLAPDKSIWEVISDGQDVISLGNREVNSRAYVARFNFSGADQQKKVSMLSGGERNRVHLARMLKEEANVLLLDEPTNDLDTETLELLEDLLVEVAIGDGVGGEGQFADGTRNGAREQDAQQEGEESHAKSAIEEKEVDALDELGFELI